MALDLSKEISFSSLRKPVSKSRASLPEKTYMNLAVVDRKSLEVRKAVPVAILVIVVLALFLKFGVYDFVNRVNVKQAELASQQQVLSGIESQLAGYQGVREEYELYASAKMSANESAVPTLDVLDLVDSVIAPAAKVQSMSYENNKLVLNLSGISLGEAGNLVSALQERPIVANVAVSNAATGQASAQGSTVAMTVTLQKAGDAR